jgi:hypothetical protein
MPKSRESATRNRRTRERVPAACVWIYPVLAIFLAFGTVFLGAQQSEPAPSSPPKNGQINVNWLYGSYVPKDVPLEPMDRDMRFKLYIRQTYTSWGIYIKTVFFATRDQISDKYPEWGDGFEGYMKRFGSRQVEFIIQNSTIALGDGLLGWEPRYDRCRCTGFWPRTRHAMIRNFVTYDRTEKSLRPQLMPYLGAFAGSTTATTWVPGDPQWQIKGYQAVITQVPVGMAINWLGEFAPEIGKAIRRKKTAAPAH